jgi:hypothetical protein
VNSAPGTKVPSGPADAHTGPVATPGTGTIRRGAGGRRPVRGRQPLARNVKEPRVQRTLFPPIGAVFWLRDLGGRRRADRVMRRTSPTVRPVASHLSGRSCVSSERGPSQRPVGPGLPHPWVLRRRSRAGTGGVVIGGRWPRTA